MKKLGLRLGSEMLTKEQMRNVVGGTERGGCVLDCFGPSGDWEGSMSGAECPDAWQSSAACAGAFMPEGSYPPSNPQYDGGWVCTCY